MSKTPVIAIVDDDASVREATKGLVRSLGYAVVTFASAEEYLHSDRVADTSCLITDVRMSGMSGLELQERLTAAGYRPPIIFMTAFPDEELCARALNAGAFGFLHKPFSDDGLVECLYRALDGAGVSGARS